MVKAGCWDVRHRHAQQLLRMSAWWHTERLRFAPQVISCEQARISLDEVFGPDAKGFIAGLNTEGHHRGAVAAVKSQQLKEVRHAH